MISLETTLEKPNSSSLIVTSKEKQVTTSFSECLHGIVTKKNHESLGKSNTLIFSLKDENINTKNTLQTQKKNILFSFLEAEMSLNGENRVLKLHSDTTKNFSEKELQVLMKDAKKFLSNQIRETEGYKKTQIQQLPKTLTGLVKMAKSYGIDLSKITLESLQNKEIKPISQEAQAEVNTKKQFTKTEKTPILFSSQTVQQKGDHKQRNREDTKIMQLPKEILKSPFLKMQARVIQTTEQIIQGKSLKIQEKPQQKRSHETLKLLLRGEKASKKDKSGLTADFSVATARVIAPSAKTQSNQDLESLLQGDIKRDENTFLTKSDSFPIHKSESFEIKLNEAKQMTKYLSQDVKAAIDDYKSPFTRVKVQLNPQRLGEVDVTIIQRGKDLHINLSSNNAAINALSMNVNDLKVQLQNNGINNASLNFNNNSQGGEQAGSGQQQQHNREANKEYNYFLDQEESEEIVSSLEIIVPDYA